MIKVTDPSISVNVPIAIFNVFVGSFLTINVENGTDSNAPMIKDGARPQFTVSREIIKTITPTIHVNPSAREVMPTALLPLTPERI